MSHLNSACPLYNPLKPTTENDISVRLFWMLLFLKQAHLFEYLISNLNDHDDHFVEAFSEETRNEVLVKASWLLTHPSNSIQRWSLLLLLVSFFWVL